MLGVANPMFLIGLIALHEREPKAVNQALLIASERFYLAMEQNTETNRFMNRIENRKGVSK
jgi:hypothetical protein